MVNKIVKFALGVYYLIILSGCASVLSIGDPNYACDGQPGSPRCMSIEDAYDATAGDDYKERSAEVAEMKRPVNRDAFSRDKPEVGVEQASPNLSYGQPTYANTGEPFVVKDMPGYMTGAPDVQPVVKRRVWVAPWISASGQFYDQQLIYVKHAPAWVGQERVSMEQSSGNLKGSDTNNVFRPLQVDRAPRRENR